MINAVLEQFDENIDKKLDKVLLKEDDIISDIASEHATTRNKIDDYGASINNISPIKSVQRGITASAQMINIVSVNMSKTIVMSVSKGSTGYVAARGDMAQKLSGTAERAYGRGSASGNAEGSTSYTLNLSGNSSITGGTTDLTVKEFSARLNNSTTLVCDGPVEWQVVEFN